MLPCPEFCYHMYHQSEMSLTRWSIDPITRYTGIFYLTRSLAIKLFLLFLYNVGLQRNSFIKYWSSIKKKILKLARNFIESIESINDVYHKSS